MYAEPWLFQRRYLLYATCAETKIPTSRGGVGPGFVPGMSFGNRLLNFVAANYEGLTIGSRSRFHLLPHFWTVIWIRRNGVFAF